ACVEGEIGNVQAERGPVANVRGERGGEQAPERDVHGLEPHRLGQNVTEPAAADDRPTEEERSPAEQQRRGPAFELLNPLQPLDDDPDLDSPEDRERYPDADRNVRPPGRSGNDQRVQSQRADPRLNAKPPAGNQRTEDRGNVGAADAEARAAQYRKRNAVF